ncbi:MAG: tetratricopeptide repeat protein [Promethearchaeota archaeon]
MDLIIQCGVETTRCIITRRSCAVRTRIKNTQSPAQLESKEYRMLPSVENSGDVNTLFDQATSLIKKKNFGEAMAKLEHGLSVDPSNTQAWENLAICNLEMGKPKLAIEALNSLLKLDPNSSSTWADKGFIHLLLNENSDGINALRESVKLQPRNVRKWELLASALVGEENWDEAVDALEKSLDLNPNSAVTWYNLAVCYLFFEDFNSALEAVEYAIGIEPSLEDIASPWVNLIDDAVLDEDYPSIPGIAAS